MQAILVLVPSYFREIIIVLEESSLTIASDLTQVSVTTQLVGNYSLATIRVGDIFRLHLRPCRPSILVYNARHFQRATISTLLVSSINRVSTSFLMPYPVCCLSRKSERKIHQHWNPALHGSTPSQPNQVTAVKLNKIQRMSSDRVLFHECDRCVQDGRPE